MIGHRKIFIICIAVSMAIVLISGLLVGSPISVILPRLLLAGAIGGGCCLGIRLLIKKTLPQLMDLRSVLATDRLADEESLNKEPLSKETEDLYRETYTSDSSNFTATDNPPTTESDTDEISSHSVASKNYAETTEKYSNQPFDKKSISPTSHSASSSDLDLATDDISKVASVVRAVLAEDTNESGH